MNRTKEAKVGNKQFSACMAWCAVVWHGVVSREMIWYVKSWHGMAWYV